MTLRMMATVSELSMYQATALKLEQERNDQVLRETLKRVFFSATRREASGVVVLSLVGFF